MKGDIVTALQVGVCVCGCFNVEFVCVMSTGAWLPLQGCVTEAQQKTGV